jgi:hypothetical protein
MDFKPTEEQRAWEERAERLAREALAPRAAAMDKRRSMPRGKSDDIAIDGDPEGTCCNRRSTMEIRVAELERSLARAERHVRLQRGGGLLAGAAGSRE